MDGFIRAIWVSMTKRDYVYIVDRKKDMIISGGENIYPREIEEVLYKHPAVAEAAVIGAPDDVWIERVHALIVLKEGRHATEEEMIEFCKHHLARYKAPKSVEFVESLPKNPQGKILKRELRKKYWKGLRGKDLTGFESNRPVPIGSKLVRF